MKTIYYTLKTVAAKLTSASGSLLMTLLMIFAVNLQAQDIILLKNGNEIKAKILELSENEVRYQNLEDQNGVARRLLKTEIFMIKYENGTKEVFESNSPVTPIVHQPKEVVYAAAKPEKFDPDTSDFAKIKRKKFNGPRVGFTMITPGSSTDYLSINNKRPFITQFGWQFEGRLFTVEETSGIVELVPMIGGLEQGMFIPSLSALIGIRGGNKFTYEFALGPNISVGADYAGNKEPFFGVVLAAGTSLKKGNVYFPITVAFVPSVGKVKEVYDPATKTDTKVTYHTGARISLIVGFNTRKK